jgi:hypothetical protein
MDQFGMTKIILAKQVQIVSLCHVYFVFLAVGRQAQLVLLMMFALANIWKVTFLRMV